MEELTLFTLDTPYRQSLPIKAWKFGDPDKKTLAVIGALRGNELQQMYICSRLIRKLKELEAEARLSENVGIMVVPCLNQFSMNVGKRFWAADNSDINRMFPGYDQGETTQRIADKIFKAVEGYRYGIAQTSVYLRGTTLPNVRVMHTGYTDESEGLDFGLPYAVIRMPKPYDTTTLNYNWQIWDTTAMSMYSPYTEQIDTESADICVNAICRFLNRKGYLSGSFAPMSEHPRLVREEALHNILTTEGGFFNRLCRLGDKVSKGDVLGQILDPFDNSVREHLLADCDGTVFFMYHPDLVSGHEIAFRLLPDEL